MGFFDLVKNNKKFSKTKKNYFEIKKSNTKIYPTVEETVKAIISGFTEQQLKSLAVLDDDGKTISFEDQLLAEFYYYKPIGDIQYTKNKITEEIIKTEKIFEIEAQDKKILFFTTICQDFFMKTH